MTKHHNLQCSAAALKHFSDVHVDSWDSQYLGTASEGVQEDTHTHIHVCLSIHFAIAQAHTAVALFIQSRLQEHTLTQ